MLISNDKLAGATQTYEVSDILRDAVEFRQGDLVSEIKNIDDCDDCVVFHAGTVIKDGKLVTSGGRVLNICATGDSLDEVREKVYKVANKIDFDGKFYRNDIGLR